MGNVNTDAMRFRVRCQGLFVQVFANTESSLAYQNGAG